MPIIIENMTIIPYFTASKTSMTNFEKVLAEKEQWVGGTCLFHKTGEANPIQRHIYDMEIKDDYFYLQLGYVLHKTPLAIDGVFNGEDFIFHCLYDGYMVMSKQKCSMEWAP